MYFYAPARLSSVKVKIRKLFVFIDLFFYQNRPIDNKIMYGGYNAHYGRDRKQDKSGQIEPDHIKSAQSRQCGRCHHHRDGYVIKDCFDLSELVCRHDNVFACADLTQRTDDKISCNMYDYEYDDPK